VQNNNPSHTHNSTPKTQTVKQRLDAAKTAYLSIPSHLPEAIKADLLKRVRRKFSHLRIGSYATKFKSKTEWRKHIARFLADVDVLIVAIDSTRLAGLGVGREIDQARRAGKLIVLFDIQKNWQLRYFGFDVIEENGKRKGIKLRDDARSRAHTQEKFYDAA